MSNAGPSPRSPARQRRFLAGRHIADWPSEREQAEEGQYIRKRELEQLKKSQDKLKAAQAEVVSCSTLLA